MEETLKPCRRWLRFSLRTLFVLVTVVCVSCAYLRAMNWKRHREGFLVQDAHDIETRHWPAPFSIWLVGGHGCYGFNIYTNDPHLTNKEQIIAETKSLFPEAENISLIYIPIKIE